MTAIDGLLKSCGKQIRYATRVVNVHMGEQQTFNVGEREVDFRVRMFSGFIPLENPAVDQQAVSISPSQLMAGTRYAFVCTMMNQFHNRLRRVGVGALFFAVIQRFSVNCRVVSLAGLSSPADGPNGFAFMPMHSRSL